MNHFSLCPVVFCFHDKQRRVRSASLMIKISKIFELFLQYSKKCTIFTTFTHSHIHIFTYSQHLLHSLSVPNTLLPLVPLFVHHDMQVNLHTVYCRLDRITKTPRYNDLSSIIRVAFLNLCTL